MYSAARSLDSPHNIDVNQHSIAIATLESMANNKPIDRNKAWILFAPIGDWQYRLESTVALLLRSSKSEDTLPANVSIHSPQHTSSVIPHSEAALVEDATVLRSSLLLTSTSILNNVEDTYL